MGKYSRGKLGLPFKTIIKIKPSEKAVKNHIEAIGEALRAQVTGAVVSRLNSIVRGWCNYFKTVASKFGKCRQILFLKLMNWGCKKHPRRGKKWIYSKYYVSIDEGQFCSQEGANTQCIKSHSDYPIVRHSKVQGNRSVYDGDTVYWSKRLANAPGVSRRVKLLLRRQKGRCNVCNNPFQSGDLMEVDHIVPKKRLGKDETKNLQLLHAHCHDTKSAAD